LLQIRGKDKKDLFYVLDIFTFIKQKADKLIRDIRDFSFIIDCQQINDNRISFLVKIISDDPCTTTLTFTLTSYCHSYLSDTFAKKGQEELDAMWERGEMTEEKLKSFETLHERTPYRR
jgi:hypothetical protein